MFPYGFPEHLDSGMRNWNAFFYVDSFKISFPGTKCQVLRLQQKTKHCSWPEECLTQLGRKSHELQKQRGKTPWCVRRCSEKESAPTVMGVVLGCGRRLATRIPPDWGKWADIRAHHGSNTAYNPNSFFKTAHPGDVSEPRFAFDGSDPICYFTSSRPVFQFPCSPSHPKPAPS